MNKYETEALRQAIVFAPKAEMILGIDGVKEELGKIGRQEIRFSSLANRDFDIAAVATIAGALINLFMWLGQIKNGQILKNASREEIVQDITARVLDNDQLPAATKERLVSKALDQLPPE